MFLNQSSVTAKSLENISERVFPNRDYQMIAAVETDFDNPEQNVLNHSDALIGLAFDSYPPMDSIDGKDAKASECWRIISQEAPA